MFSLHAIWQWRSHVDENPEWRVKYEGRHLETIEIDFRKQHDNLPPQERIGDLYPPAKIFGKPLDPSCLDGSASREIQGPPPVLRTFRDARVIGYSALLTSGGLQIARAERSTQPGPFMEANNFGAQGFIAEEINERVYIHFGRRKYPKRFDVHALFFPNIEPSNFGSFLFRCLPQMLHLANLGIQAGCYIVAERTPWVLEALQLLGFPERPVLTAEEVTGDIFTSVTMCIMYDLDGFVRPETRAFIRKTIDDAAADTPDIPAGQKIYVSRELQYLSRPDYRQMSNEADVQKLVAAHGFRTIWPETLSLGAQMRLFASASHVVGASGSGMLNTMFARSGARVVDIETASFGVDQHARIYSSCGHDYVFVFSETDPNDDRSPHLRHWTAPIGLIEQALDWCLSK